MVPGSMSPFSSTTAPRVSISSASFGVTCSICSEAGFISIRLLSCVFAPGRGRLPDLKRLRHYLDAHDIFLCGRGGVHGAGSRVLVFGTLTERRTNFGIHVQGKVPRPVDFQALSPAD